MGKSNPKCNKCWDKGYSTELIGKTIACADFDGDIDRIISPSQIRKNFCKCAKGRRLKSKEQK